MYCVTSLVVVALVSTQIECQRINKFVWITGKWSSCQPDLHHTSWCGPGGLRTRTVTCAVNPSLPLRDEITPTCPTKSKPSETSPCFLVCDHHRHMYRWVVGEWNACQPKSVVASLALNSSGLQCQLEDGLIGVQMRSVTCRPICSIYTNDVIGMTDVYNEPCSSLLGPEPPTSRPCRLVVNARCPRDCIVTELSNWSPCCAGYQTRRRHVLLSAAEEGRTCRGPMSEVRRCSGGEGEHNSTCRSVVPPSELNYIYYVGRWTDCRPRSGQTLVGYRQRSVRCVDTHQTNRYVNSSRCHGNPPISVELCVVSKRNCHSMTGRHDNWTTYSESLYGAISSLQTPSSMVNLLYDVTMMLPECSVIQIDSVRQQNEHEKNMCSSHRWITGEWNNCHTQFKCGTGVQQRAVLCVRITDSVPVTDSNCGTEPPQHTRACQVPCRHNCVVSEWSEWSDCLPDRCRMPHDARNKSKEGLKVRSRHVIEPSQNGGRDCEYLNQFQTCDYPMCHSSVVSALSDCTLDVAASCGQGTRNKTIVCINIDEEVIDWHWCSENRPALTEPCVVPCPDDCIMSEWSIWSTCSHTGLSGCRSGQRTRQRKVLAPATSPDGSTCSKYFAEKERCEVNIGCPSYHWQTSDWSNDCNAEHKLSTSGQSGLQCGGSTQIREATCVDSATGDKVPAKRCSPEFMPLVRRECVRPCPVNCVVSAFTDWTSCASSCIDDDMTRFPEQHRIRFVLQHPTTDGIQCPDLTEVRPCTSLPRCTHFRWHATAWSACLFTNVSAKCGHGYRIRELRCLNEREEVFPDEHCQHGIQDVKPVAIATCSVVCRSPDSKMHCIFSEWSSWSLCSKRCDGNSMRQRFMEGSSSHVTECLDRTLYPLQQTRPCRTDCVGNWTVRLTGQWSDCILTTRPTTEMFQTHSNDDAVPLLPDSVPGSAPASLTVDGVGTLSAAQWNCGIGRRYHTTVCHNTHSRHNVSAAQCSASDRIDEMCFVPCHRDCLMSAWTSWSSCKVMTSQRCGNGERQRSRYLVETSLDGGRDCPPLTDNEEYEMVPCHEACEHFQWQFGEWGHCTPTGPPRAESSMHDIRTTLCGHGLQSRTVKCVHRLEDSEEWIDAEEGLCDRLTKPREVSYCSTPCRGHCVLSLWTEWTSCDQECGDSSRRRRTRHVMRHPMMNVTGAECPPLEEFDRCDQSIKCAIYRAEWSDWGACQLHEDSAECGYGRRQRYWQCVRAIDSSIVEHVFCTANWSVAINTPVDNKSCTKPCPVDCVVSEWSSWSICSRTCGLGLQTRSRQVLVHSNNGGRHCPEMNVQRKFCPFTDCYQWSVGPWTECNINSSNSTSCGHGSQHRSVICQHLEGFTVDMELCSPHLLLQHQLTQVCTVPCPGDCVVSDWSPWSPCHLHCQVTDPEGYQSRSRVIWTHGSQCPENLVETRTCANQMALNSTATECPRYSWNASEWIDGRRSVWCQDQHGRVVYGGCRETLKPSSNKVCYPPCVAPGSSCQDLDVCACNDNLIPVFKNNYLISCELPHTITENSIVLFGDSVDVWLYVVMVIGFLFIAILLIAITIVWYTMPLTDSLTGNVQSHIVPGADYKTVPGLRQDPHTMKNQVSLKTKQTRPEPNSDRVTSHQSTSADTAAKYSEKCTNLMLTSSQLELCKHCESNGLNKAATSQQTFDCQLTSSTCNAYFTLQNHRCYRNPDRCQQPSSDKRNHRRSSADRHRHNDVMCCHDDTAVSSNFYDGTNAWSATIGHPRAALYTSNLGPVVECKMCTVNL